MNRSFFESGSLLSLDQNRLLIGWGKREWITEPTKALTPFFYFPDFFLENQTPWFSHEHWKILSLADFSRTELVQENSIDHQNSIDHLLDRKYLDRQYLNWQCHLQEIFSQQFFELKKMFETESLSKAVPYVFFTHSQQMTENRLKMTLAAAVKSSLEKQGHLYGFWTHNEGILGVSPELLFCHDQDKKLVTLACAGTHQIKDRLFEPKILDEHQIVIQGIQESLKTLGQIQIGKTEVKELALLSHLYTPIYVDLFESFDFEAMIKALHPTPALGAYPKLKGVDWLKQYERRVPRYRFGAPVGCLINQEEAFCYVAIRNVQWNQEGMFIGAGCGVTLDSQMEDEWQEIQLKFQSIRKMLRL